MTEPQPVSAPDYRSVDMLTGTVTKPEDDDDDYTTMQLGMIGAWW